VGKRSRSVAIKRKKQPLLDRLIRTNAVMGLYKLEFCRKAAMLADSESYERSGSRTAVEWISIHCHMDATDAADCIAIGRYLTALDAKREAARNGATPPV